MSIQLIPRFPHLRLDVETASLTAGFHSLSHGLVALPVSRVTDPSPGLRSQLDQWDLTVDGPASSGSGSTVGTSS